MALTPSVALALISSVGCGASYPTAPEPTLAAVRIHVTSTVWDLVPASTAQVVAYAVDSDGVYTDVTDQASWSTSDGGVLSTLPVRNGRVVVRSVSPGDADLIASYRGNTDRVTLRVFRFPRSTPRLELDGAATELVIAPDRTRTLTVSVRHFAVNGSVQNVTSAATITTSNPNVAIVDGSTVRPVSPGTFRVLATYNGMTATALASVSPATLAALP
jgi:hypothetical protein